MRKYKALVNETGLDDFGASGITFEVKSIIKDKIYEEGPIGYVIDDNGCWNQIGSKCFIDRFLEIPNAEIRDKKIKKILKTKKKCKLAED